MDRATGISTSFFLTTVLGLFTTLAAAQAINDSCPSATDLGILEYSQLCLFDLGNGQPGTFPFSDSTVLAGPEFPYPAMPLPCDGYAASVTAPSNDVWYTFHPMCSFAIEVKPGPFFITDTVHISVWHGPDCSQLVPLRCYTLAANTVLNDSSLPYYQGIYYLQVSSPSLSSVSRFSICLRGTQLPCAPSVYSYGEPTPVVCFPYSLTIVNATEQNGSGSASLVLDEAFGPYTIQWSDGTADVQSRSDLPVGDHAVTVTSSQGCTQVISVAILLEPALGLGLGICYDGIRVNMDHGLLVLTGTLGTPAKSLEVFDIRGAKLGTWHSRTDGTFPVGSLSTGVYVARLYFADANTLRIPFAIIH